MTDLLAEPLQLPCGLTLPNRLVKSGMSESLATRDGAPTPGLRRLYATWARGGAGLLITGNAMIDRTALVEPRNVILQDERQLPAFREWTSAVHDGGSRIFLQINHPGRVAALPFNRPLVAPSAIREPMPGMRKPKALTANEIRDLVQRYARTAALAAEAGFDGVQIHAAHGYLLSQFLSPLANQRDDEYGGDAAGRRRMLLEVVAATRAAVGPSYPIAVKLNSKDFQYGGLEEDESLDVAGELAASGIDLLEISGGNYSAPAMQGVLHPEGSDAYFRRYAERVRSLVDVPLMLTGGLRTRATMEDVIRAGVDLIGMARPLAFVTDYPARLLAHEIEPTLPAAPRLRNRGMAGMAQIAMHNHQLHRIAAGLSPQLAPSPATVLSPMWRMVKGNATQAVLPRR